MNTRKEPAMATTPESFVDALNSAFGKQTTQRSAHAKGVVLLGTFVPSARTYRWEPSFAGQRCGLSTMSAQTVGRKYSIRP